MDKEIKDLCARIKGNKRLDIFRPDGNDTESEIQFIICFVARCSSASEETAGTEEQRLLSLALMHLLNYGERMGLTYMPHIVQLREFKECITAKYFELTRALVEHQAATCDHTYSRVITTLIELAKTRGFDACEELDTILRLYDVIHGADNL